MSKLLERPFGLRDQRYVKKTLRNVLANAMCGVTLKDQFRQSSKEGRNFLRAHWKEIAQLVVDHEKILCELLSPPKPKPPIPTYYEVFVSFLYSTFEAFWNN